MRIESNNQRSGKVALDDYFKDAFNIEIFDQLKSINLAGNPFEDELQKTKEPVELYNLLYSKFESFKLYVIDKDYAAIASLFDEVFPSLSQTYHFVDVFIQLVVDKYPYAEFNDERFFDVCFKALLRIHTDLSYKAYPKYTNTLTSVKYSFDHIKDWMRGMDDNEKINHLTDAKVPYAPEFLNVVSQGHKTRFDSLCDLEIKRIQRIEVGNDHQSLNVIDPTKSIRKAGTIHEHETKSVEESNEDLIITKVNAKEATTRRQVLAMHFIFNKLNAVPNHTTSKALFIQFLTEKEKGAKYIGSTNIYKMCCSPYPTDDNALKEDLQYIRTHFENLGLSEIVSEINKEINTRS